MRFKVLWVWFLNGFKDGGYGEKKHCPFCGGSEVIRRGFYGNGRRRWYCKECSRSYHWSDEYSKRRKERIWFERWIVEGYSVRQLSQQSGHSKAKLYRIINYWLSQSPRESQDSLASHRYLIFDGTFFHRPVSIIALMDGETNEMIKGEYGVHENSISDLMGFLSPLRDRGLEPVSVTVDGNPQAMKAIRTLWPGVILQRCVVHVQRQGIMWCRRPPKRTDASRLRELFFRVDHIRTAEKRDQFTEDLMAWEARYGEKIKQRPGVGRVFSDLKKARSMLINALPDMFHYLDDRHIPPSTNALEGYFSRLKGHYRQHRGLTKRKWRNYLNWFFYLKPK